jgi:HEAT repeat protein
MDMIKKSLLKLLPVLLLSFAQNVGIVGLVNCELTPTKVMAQEQDDSSVEIDRLTQQLRSASNRKQNNAVIALGKMGASAQSVIPQLFTIIFVPYPEHIRVNASISIRQIVESTQSEIPKFLPLLNHSNPDVRANVATSISNMRGSAGYAMYRLNLYKLYGKDSNPKVRANLAATFKQIENSDRLVNSQLMPLLKDLNPLVRASAAIAIINIEGEAKSTIPKLIPLLQDSDSAVRANAVAVMGMMREEAKSTIPQILPLLKDSDSSVRFNAIFALQGMGKLTKSTVVQILPLLKDSNSGIRQMAVTALGKMGKSSKAVIPQLVPLLKDPAEYVRSTTVQVLEEMGDSATSTIPGLEKLLEEARPKGRTISALVYVVTKGAVNQASDISNLVPLLKDPDPRIRYIAADALGEIGDAAKSTIPQLTTLLKDPDRNVVNRARAALKKLENQK